MNDQLLKSLWSVNSRLMHFCLVSIRPFSAQAANEFAVRVAIRLAQAKDWDQSFRWMWFAWQCFYKAHPPYDELDATQRRWYKVIFLDWAFRLYGFRAMLGLVDRHGRADFELALADFFEVPLRQHEFFTALRKVCLPAPQGFNEGIRRLFPHTSPPAVTQQTRFIQSVYELRTKLG